VIAPGRRSWTKGRVILIKSLRLPLPVRRMSKLQSASLEMHKSRQGRLTPCANGQPFRDLSCCGRSFPTLKHCAYRMSGTKAWPAFSGLLLHQILTRHWAGSLRCRVVTACCRACTCRSWPKTGRFPRSGAGIHPQILLTRRQDKRIGRKPSENQVKKAIVAGARVLERWPIVRTAVFHEGELLFRVPKTDLMVEVQHDTSTGKIAHLYVGHHKTGPLVALNSDHTGGRRSCA